LFFPIDLANIPTQPAHHCPLRPPDDLGDDHTGSALAFSSGLGFPTGAAGVSPGTGFESSPPSFCRAKSLFIRTVSTADKPAKIAHSIHIRRSPGKAFIVVPTGLIIFQKSGK
jgi:hypothetical protein